MDGWETIFNESGHFRFREIKYVLLNICSYVLLLFLLL